ncbi:MAG: tyrosine--tRNA ligase, partial [Bdellovibrionota bacterium]
NHMMAKESVRARLEDREHGISYTEFSYMLLQAYDFYVLHQKEGCRLQIGGSDQWGNITAGNELIRRMGAANGAPVTSENEVFGLTHPLVSKSDGAKFGKTEKGNIWLDAKKTSPYQFYQFLVRTADADVMNLIKYFSFLPEADIRALDTSTQKEPEKRAAQTALARELTLMVHGPAEVEKVEKASQALFGTGIRDLDRETLLDVMGEAPSTEKPKSILSPGYPLVDVLTDSALCQGKGAARKDIAAGGIYVNNERVSDPALNLTPQHLIAGSYIVLRKGKKTYHLMSFK